MTYEELLLNIGQFGLITINGDHRYKKQIHGWIKEVRGETIMFYCNEGKKYEFVIKKIINFEKKQFKP